jgi:hypothetical protein
MFTIAAMTDGFGHAYRYALLRNSVTHHPLGIYIRSACDSLCDWNLPAAFELGVMSILVHGVHSLKMGCMTA